MVVIFLPATLETAVMQERVASPLMCTVQAPHMEMPQPNFVPVMFSVSRSTQSSGMSGLTSTEVALPFKVKLMAIGDLPFADGYPTTNALWMKIRGKPISRSADRRPGSAGLKYQTPRITRCEQTQLPSAGAGLGRALGACRGASGSTPRQPTGRPLTASFTEPDSTTYINWRKEKRCHKTGVSHVQPSLR